MQVNFSTNNATTALQYLQKAMPSSNLTEESAKPILDLVREGKIRVGDPFMYNGNCPIYPEPSCTDADQERVKGWYSASARPKLKDKVSVGDSDDDPCDLTNSF